MDEKDEKRLQHIRGKIAQFKAQEKSFTARIKEKERKARTRRLIQNGALAEKYLECENFSPMQFEERLKEVLEKLKTADNAIVKTFPSADEIMEKIENDFGYSEDEVVQEDESEVVYNEEPVVEWAVTEED